MTTKANKKGNLSKEPRSQHLDAAVPPSANSKATQETKKRTKGTRNKSGQGKASRIKAITLICIALFFFGYMIYSGGSTVGYLSLVIGLVCGLLGVLYFREGEKDD